MKLEYNNRVWIVSEDTTPVAEIHLDYCDQLHEVVLYADSSDKIQLQVLRLAASHAQQFVKDRSVPGMGGPMVAQYRDNNLTAADSHRLMDFALIPKEIQQLNSKTIVERLRSLQVDVTFAVHKTGDEAIEAAVLHVGAPSLRYGLVPQRMIFDNEIMLWCTVAKPERFIFWRHESIPTDKGWDLHVVPSYHPVMNGWKAVGMVNGTSNAYIRGNAVRSIYCPKAAQSDRSDRNFGTSWDHVKHPFYAVGRSIGIRLNTTKLRSQDGVDELTAVLRAALGQGKKYVAINGGFRAPMRCAHNRLLELNRRSPYPRAYHSRTGNVVRGSEEHCVWAYRTLKVEGALASSHVPDWFIKEGWLEIYEGAEVRPTLF